MSQASQPWQKYVGPPLALAIVAAMVVILPIPGAQAANLAQVIRKLAGVADDIPVRGLDEVVEDAATRRAGRRLLGDLNRGKRLDDLAEESAALRYAWKKGLGVGDSRLLRELESLPPASQRAALVVAHGGQRLKAVVPDVAVRSRLVSEGGAETLAALGRFEDLAEDALGFHVALKAGKLPSPPGARSLTLNDFGRFFHTQGDRAHHFWSQYVRPHWKLWLGSAALAAVLLAPEEYLDAMGRLTQQGLEKLGRFAGKRLADVIGGTIAGAGAGTKEVVTGTARSLARTFFTSGSGLASASVLALGALLLLRPTRRWIFRTIRRVLGARQPPAPC